MRRDSSGFTLLEVLLALLVLTAGLLGFAGTLGPMSALAGQGRLRSRAAVMLASRVSRLRSELQSGAPGCVLPPAGTAVHPSGLDESWASSLSANIVELRIIARIRLPGRIEAETLITRFPCP
ncbi:MAG TPA: prepilin-type N-terminal cleavage/methylation domain-containing protein [Gemmatimonadales bacterium]|nr:prepilin-type N-terminal cleavage/methylation domain-containing protein [Gemmatimonadales bacterium]